MVDWKECLFNYCICDSMWRLLINKMNLTIHLQIRCVVCFEGNNENNSQNSQHKIGSLLYLNELWLWSTVLFKDLRAYDGIMYRTCGMPIISNLQQTYVHHWQCKTKCLFLKNVLRTDSCKYIICIINIGGKRYKSTNIQTMFRGCCCVRSSFLQLFVNV